MMVYSFVARKLTEGYRARDHPSARLGRYIVKQFEGETVRAFVPPLLPPVLPVDLARFQILLEQANQAIGRLDGLASLLPDWP